MIYGWLNPWMQNDQGYGGPTIKLPENFQLLRWSVSLTPSCWEVFWDFELGNEVPGEGSRRRELTIYYNYVTMGSVNETYCFLLWLSNLKFAFLNFDNPNGWARIALNFEMLRTGVSQESMAIFYYKLVLCSYL